MFTAVAASDAGRCPPTNGSGSDRAWLSPDVKRYSRRASRTDAALNVLLGLSILLAAASVGYAVTVPKDGERFSDFYLLTEGETPTRR